VYKRFDLFTFHHFIDISSFMEDLQKPSESDRPSRFPVEPIPMKTPQAQVPPISAPVEAASPKGGGVKKMIKLTILLAALIAAAFFGYREFEHMRTFEETDDAFVAAHVHTITAKVPGMVTSVLVDDHMEVTKGQLLVKLDAREYEAQVRISQSKTRKASQDVARMKRGHDYDEDEEGNVDGIDLSSPDAYAPDEQRVLDEYHASASESSNELQRAMLNIEYTSIRAPANGRIGKRSVESGQMVGAGQAVMALVEPDAWINANFKETQLGRIRVGQPVEIKIDAIPDHKFSGKVESIAAASGATYSLLPPDNATGNFTKIVQRVPVKIVFDPGATTGYEDRIAAGMSTVVEVRVRP
jgi:membrane fusion protein, multidrug efflux system